VVEVHFDKFELKENENLDLKKLVLGKIGKVGRQMNVEVMARINFLNVEFFKINLQIFCTELNCRPSFWVVNSLKIFFKIYFKN